MSTQNERAIEVACEAFAAVDLERIRKEAFADDMRWTWLVSGALSGTYKDVDAVLALFGQLATGSKGTFKVAPESIAGVGDFVVVRSSATWTDGAGEHTDPYVQFFRMKNDRATECDIFLSDAAGLGRVGLVGRGGHFRPARGTPHTNLRSCS